MPGSGRCPAGGTGNPLQCSGLESPKDRGAWWATVHGATKSQTQLSERAHRHTMKRNFSNKNIQMTNRYMKKMFNFINQGNLNQSHKVVTLHI